MKYTKLGCDWAVDRRSAQLGVEKAAAQPSLSASLDIVARSLKSVASGRALAIFKPHCVQSLNK